MPKENRISKRGFASMSPERLKKIARKGGMASHQKGTAHEFSSTEAKIAGKRGGRKKTTI